MLSLGASFPFWKHRQARLEPPYDGEAQAGQGQAWEEEKLVI